MFNVRRGSRLIKTHRIAGDIPLLTAGEFNQGVKEYISNTSQEIFENAITIDMFCNVFVHIKPFCCDDNILVLNAKDVMNSYHLRFISVMIARDKAKYGYDKQYRLGSFSNHKISLPTLKATKEIHFNYMENFIKALEKDRIKQVILYQKAVKKAYEKVVKA